MTSEEFKTWFRAHRAAFTGIGAWFDRMPSTPTETTPSRAEVFQAWFDTLRGVRLEDALAATRSLANGESEEPKSFDAHPRIVRRLASDRNYAERQRSSAHRTIGGEETFRCLLCRDKGRVLVAHPESVKLLAGGAVIGGPRTKYRAIVACSCAAGESHHDATGRKKPGKGLVRLDDSHHVIDVADRRQDQDAALMEFSESYAGSRQCANYEPAFEAFQ